jgi:GTP-binding protein HflX
MRWFCWTHPCAYSREEVAHEDEKQPMRRLRTLYRQRFRQEFSGEEIARPAPERALLVGVEIKGEETDWPLENSMEELAELARTAGLEVVGRVTQALESIHPATYIGQGKVEQIQEIIATQDVDIVVFDVDLSPTQQRNLEEALNVRIIDRTALILDIFAKHARTREGALQVELAQYEYRLPRLTRQWTHLSRQGVGGVGLRGPGETQLESDRRLIRKRITQLRKELEEVREHRQRYRQRRREAAIPTVALVGYTNAGKSTLLNTLSGAGVLVEDKLFATLDPTTRRVKLPGGREVLFTDTVGFIHKLPTMLVAAFRATLEEISEADLLIHVVDITSPAVLGQCRAVAKVLKEVGADHIPIITALNKIDKLESPAAVQEMLKQFPNSVGISALTGEGVDRLLELVDRTLTQQMIDVVVRIPFSAGELVSLFHRFGSIEKEEHTPEGVEIVGQLPVDLAGRFAPYMRS